MSTNIVRNIFHSKKNWRDIIINVRNCILTSYVYLFIFFVFVVPYVYLLYYVCIAVLTLDAGLLARSQNPEGPVTGHLDTGFSRFPVSTSEY